MDQKQHARNVELPCLLSHEPSGTSACESSTRGCDEPLHRYDEAMVVLNEPRFRLTCCLVGCSCAPAARPSCRPPRARLGTNLGIRGGPSLAPQPMTVRRDGTGGVGSSIEIMPGTIASLASHRARPKRIIQLAARARSSAAQSRPRWRNSAGSSPRGSSPRHYPWHPLPPGRREIRDRQQRAASEQ